jgi:hypothetical protein
VITNRPADVRDYASPALQAPTYTATGEPGAAGAPALELVHSSEYLPPELMPSLGACIGADIAVLTRDVAAGDIKQRPHVYLGGNPIFWRIP